MKVIIISTPRTGSTTLLEIFSKLGFDIIFEPFEFRKDFQLKDNMCVKTIIHQVPKNENNLEFYKEYVKKFDEVILLDRFELNEHWESYLNLAYKINNKLNTNTTWVSGSTPSDFILNFTKNGGYQRFLKMKGDINLLSESINKKIIYYENLFNSNKQISLSSLAHLNLDFKNEIVNNIDLSNKFKKEKYDNLI